MKNALPTGEALRKRAETLGVVITKDDPNESSGAYEVFRARVSDAELQRRVIEAERHLQAQKMWVMAIIAAGASVVSALAAWCAVYMRSFV
ncbi:MULTISPECIES: hypothetical protein [unclassified Nitrosospira]|uniref:hypothetical protein n=1 Tax=unclassified Nitrosospira TaxID=2609267 RepID=UPI00088839B4|nr:MULTISPECIES: hypothetical protein [unclassified Nitrosospira]BCT68807.1 hypothetical protein NNRS527_02413 [Nitrosospira sp. NRS527]SCX50486.1 hypothetical protein SAMN05720354_10994 [Nitrosospira sp. Nsp1]